MTNEERYAWLTALHTTQLKALCHVAGLYSASSDWDRDKMIHSLCGIKGIEIPQETS